MPPKVVQLPTSAFSEPSEPSDIKPEQSPASQLTSSQEENPQLIAQKPGRQRAEANGESGESGENMAGKEFEDAKSSEVDSYDYEGVLDTVKRKLGVVRGKL